MACYKVSSHLYEYFRTSFASGSCFLLYFYTSLSFLYGGVCIHTYCWELNKVHWLRFNLYTIPQISISYLEFSWWGILWMGSKLTYTHSTSSTDVVYRVKPSVLWTCRDSYLGGELELTRAKPGRRSCLRHWTEFSFVDLQNNVRDCHNQALHSYWQPS